MFKIKQVKPKIFLMEFNDQYEMCMTFLRYQEYYESTSPKFRGKSFTILDFMEWYSKKYGDGAFKYPVQWGGFNIPSYIIEEVIEKGIKDHNKYDNVVKKIYNDCKKEAKGNFYLIGAQKSQDDEVIRHEIAHGFFYLNDKYRKEMINLVKNLTPSFRKSMNDGLSKLGYTQKVFVDEIQAYMSTGMRDCFPIVKTQDKLFIGVYNKYYKL